MPEDLLRSCLGKHVSTGLTSFAQPIDFRRTELNMCLSPLLVWGHSAQHFPELSPTFAMRSVTPVLGLEELTIR